jgi:phage terminase small subunit
MGKNVKVRKLTTKQNKFIEYYAGNATEAARMAGYKGNDATLRAIASENLTKPNILQAIKKREEVEINKRNVTRREKLELLTEIMRNDIAYVVTRDDGTEKIKPEIPIKERIKAIETHCKMNGDFIQKHEHSGPNGESINQNIKVIFVEPKN